MEKSWVGLGLGVGIE